MTDKTEEDIDVSGVHVKLNGHPHKVTGLRIVTHEGEDKDDARKWLQFGIQDVATGHSQCIEFEVSGLINLWNHFTGVPDLVSSVVDEIAETGKDIADRFKRAVKEFNSDSTKE